MVESTVTGADSDGEIAPFPSFTPSQILYLQQGEQRLYVQLIQILRDRNMGWLRPLCLCNPVSYSAVSPTSAPSHNIAALVPIGSNINSVTYITCDGTTLKLQDMRQSADLLWPLDQCHSVLDLEAIPILTGLGPEPNPGMEREDVRQSLNVFMQKMWHGNADH